MPVARPRTISLPKEKMIELGKEMVTWASNTPDALHLNEFYTKLKGWTYAEFKNLRVCSEFYPYYEQAIGIIGKRYLDGTVNPSIAQRWLRLYFGDLREEENSSSNEEYSRKKDLIEHQAKVSTEAINKVDAGIEEQYKAHMGMLKEMRQDMSSLANAEIIKSKDKKS